MAEEKKEEKKDDSEDVPDELPSLPGGEDKKAAAAKEAKPAEAEKKEEAKAAGKPEEKKEDAKPADAADKKEPDDAKLAPDELPPIDDKKEEAKTTEKPEEKKVQDKKEEPKQDKLEDKKQVKIKQDDLFFEELMQRFKEGETDVFEHELSQESIVQNMKDRLLQSEDKSQLGSVEKDIETGIEPLKKLELEWRQLKKDHESIKMKLSDKEKEIKDKITAVAELIKEKKKLQRKLDLHDKRQKKST